MVNISHFLLLQIVQCEKADWVANLTCNNAQADHTAVFVARGPVSVVIAVCEP